MQMWLSQNSVSVLLSSPYTCVDIPLPQQRLRVLMFPGCNLYFHSSNVLAPADAWRTHQLPSEFYLTRRYARWGYKRCVLSQKRVTYGVRTSNTPRYLLPRPFDCILPQTSLLSKVLRGQLRNRALKTGVLLRP